MSPAEYKYHAKEHDPRRLPYIIGVGDTLSIHVWKDPELSTEAIVRPDGTITMPLVGELRAAGKTSDALRAQIARALGQYVKSAVVTVAVGAVASYTFTVTGEVGHPGVFNPTHYVTVSEAVALAGGPTRYASADDTVIIRRDRKSAPPRRIPVDYDAILDGDAPEQDIVVLAGDTVYVP
jgi:polysaccharide export outer membrane protein